MNCGAGAERWDHTNREKEALFVRQKLTDELGAVLRQKREILLQEVAATVGDIETITAERESELEETAQNDRITRLASHLKERDRRTIREIDAALERIAAGTYGECALCENDIGANRLRALPTTTLCIECATAREKKQQLTRAARSSLWSSPFTAVETDDFDIAENDG
jgi:RNA polymerase-binding transcription factor